MPELDTDVRYLKGVGEKRAQSFEKLGIRSLRDLLAWFPRDYEDRRTVLPIAMLREGEGACFRGRVTEPARVARIRKGLDRTQVRVADDSGMITLVFFNQSYVASSLKPGESFVFYGRPERLGSRLIINNPPFEREGAGEVTGRILPIYRRTTGLSNLMLQRAVEQGLASCGDQLPDLLPPELRERYGLAHIRYACENIHFPPDEGAVAIARRRLIFEELLLLSLGMGLLRNRREEQTGLKLAPVPLKDFEAALPFALTGAQKRAIGEAAADLCSGRPMNRLVQGDVGSGKTMVAAACAFLAARNGLQTALMAPTEILAEQHYQNLSKLLGACGIRCGLLTASRKAKEKRETLAALAAGEIDLVVGTQALLGQAVDFHRLGLVVADEQHRFGVRQRAALSEKGDRPHILVMSATPIPRTLALIIYGDLDVSVMDELPPGRQPVETFAVDGGKRQRMYGFVRKLVGEGRQAYIVCPAVEEGEEEQASRKAVLQYAKNLQEQVFPDLRVALIHGKLKPAEKERIMAAFAAGEIDVLVATTVIEVGVDVPNAALMVVEDAERFGLSQLHQLRGRVGRGQHKSYCVLMSEHPTPDSRERLRALCATNDGFRIAEEDLKLRGPGDFFGSRQHGLPQLRIADLAGDMRVLKEAQQAAAELLAADPELQRPEHRALNDRVRSLFADNEGTMN